MISPGVRSQMRFGSVGARERSVAAHIPYLRHVEDSVLRTKDGMLVSFLKLDGFCFETADMADINGRLEGRNTILRALGSSRYAVYGHLVRRRLEPELGGSFETPFARDLNARYMAQLRQRRMFVNEMYISVVRRPLQGQVKILDGLSRFLFRRSSDKTRDSGVSDDDLRELRSTSLDVRQILESYGARILGIRNDAAGIAFSEPLEFLVQLLNGLKPVAMRLPRMPLDGALAMKRINFGRNALEFVGATPPGDTRLGAMLSIREYPSYTGPLLLDGLLKVPHEFVVSQSFSIIDRAVAQNRIERVSRQIAVADEAGSIIGDQLAGARDELLSSRSIFGEHHLTVMCIGDDKQELDRSIRGVGTALTDQSIIWLREDLNCEAAFWAQLPGNFSYIARSAMISSKNFGGFLSLHNFPSGKSRDNHWGSAISLLETTSQSAYFFNFHERDLGNFTMIGPSGSGKTVALSFLMAQSQRLSPAPRCIFFDKDRGGEIFVRALGGTYRELQPDMASGFNPLQLPDSGANRDFLFQLFSLMLRRPDGQALSASEEGVLRAAIAHILSADRASRSLPLFATLLRGRNPSGTDDLLSRFDKWLRPEQLGWLFNNADDTFSWSAISGFDMTRILDDPLTRSAALMYIFHRIEELFDGRPILIFLDEGWRLLEDEVFAAFIKNKMKTIRKFNGIIGFGTQSASDIVNSPIANTLIEQSATHIFFPNPRADMESHAGGMRLSQREVEWIRTTDPSSRSFLIKHGQESVIARLRLNDMDDLLKVLSGRAETIQELTSLRERLGDDPADWLPVFCGRKDTE
ncbi:VirB4 family type IV secretion system protein [Phyllobacterium sp. 0TCS1.6C]|uniref:VirB4 family type IV secretion system protein n=1 Tax=unclassified Phyllobacterium TaxID=2638441 RepID=UPI002263C201|nr:MULTISPECIES: VirB4 family type IV secretion system protein [unclassified Phyllobacterium]MCX8282152.1 VirB4 family type IV secretion system protein [Phyllobacterium sp. 0TCS1.6C]MCX8296360.1 VirB4 family type IV secretion system protein [Phyllobacterium sp. 0TCS1.6A]